MRRGTLILIAAATIGIATPPTAAAQVSRQAALFYDPTLGQSFAPRPSGFGGGIEVGPSGNFLYLGRPGGVAAFATPWRQVPPSPPPLLGPASAVERVLPVSPVAELPAATVGVPAPPATPRLIPAASPGRASPPTVERLGVPFGVVVRGAGGSTARRTEPFVRSPRLSELLTRIARGKGMLTGQGIEVYLSSGSALVEGTVHTPRDRTLLANVLALEPGVGKIDNRLAVGYQPNSTPANGP